MVENKQTAEAAAEELVAEIAEIADIVDIVDNLPTVIWTTKIIWQGKISKRESNCMKKMKDRGSKLH